MLDPTTLTADDLRGLAALALAEEQASAAAHAALVARHAYQRHLGLRPWHAATWDPAQGAVAATAIGWALRDLHRRPWGA